MVDTSLWFMFPVTVAIVAVAMLAGIGGGMHLVLQNLISINLS